MIDYLDEEDRKEPEPKQRDLDLQTVMKTKAGRATMCNLLDDFGLWTDTYSNNPHDHARFAGLRGAGIMLENNLKNVTPFEYKQMMKEKIDGHSE